MYGVVTIVNDTELNTLKLLRELLLNVLTTQTYKGNNVT